MERGSCIAGRYTLVAPLGAGRSGLVWAADDARTGTRVAVKIRHVASSTTPIDVEVAGLRALEHPHLVRVLDAGVDPAGHTWIVSEFVAAGSLDRVRKPLDIAAQEALAAQMLDALGYLHAHGILHADVKTENVFVAALDPPFFKLGDFGFAHGLAAGGGLRGSPAFLAPEIIRGEPADERSDLYALGITLYEAIFGQVPFDDADVRLVLTRQLTETPARLIDPGDADPRLVALLRRLLPKEAAERPADSRAAIAAWRGEDASLPTWVPPRLGVLIGRDAEMDTLLRLLASGGGAIAIDGPPGIGKTRLLREFALRAELDGARVEWWAPGSGEGDAAVEESTMAIRRVLVIDDLDELAPSAAQAAALHARDHLLNADGARLVCVVGRGTASAWLIDVLSAGDVATPKSIRLEPWSAVELGRAVSALLGARQIQPSLESVIAAATGATPLAVEVACRVLVTQRLLTPGDRGQLACSTTLTTEQLADLVADHTRSSIDTLSDGARTLLQCLSLLIGPVPVEWLLHRVAEARYELPRLHSLGLATILSQVDQSLCSIAHASARSTVLRDLPVERRRALNTMLADLYEQFDDAHMANFHRAQGTSFNEALAAARRFAAHPSVVYTPDRLARVCSSVLERWPTSDAGRDRHMVAIWLLDALHQLGDTHRTIALAESLLANTVDPTAAQEIRNRIARVHLARGDGLMAERVLGSGDGDADGESTVIRAAALAMTGRYDDVLRICRAYADRVRGDSPLLDEIRQHEAAAYSALGEMARAEAVLQAAVERRRDGRSPRQLAMHLSKLGAVQFYQGRIREAEPVMREAYELYRQLGERAHEARVLNAIACVCGETGRLEESGDLLRRALDLSRRLGETETMLLLLSNLAQLLFTLGRFDEALQRADTAVAISGRRASRMVLPSLVIRAKLYATIGLGERALDDLRRGRELEPEPLYAAQLAMVEAEVAFLGTDLFACRRVLTEVRATIETINARDELVHHGLLWSRLLLAEGDPEGALRHAEVTADHAREVGVVPGIAESEILLAELAVDSQPAVAAHVAGSVSRTAHELGLRELQWRAFRVIGQAALREKDAPTAIEAYDSCIRCLREQCDGLRPELADAYVAHPDRARVFVELDDIAQRQQGRSRAAPAS